VNCRDLKQKPNIGLSFTVLGAAVIQWSSQLKSSHPWAVYTITNNTTFWVIIRTDQVIIWDQVVFNCESIDASDKHLQNALCIEIRLECTISVHVICDHLLHNWWLSGKWPSIT
jgi:hypothetical protein